MSLWVKNTDGQPDPILTMGVISVLAILAKVILAGVGINLGSKNVNLGGYPDAGLIAALLTPLLTAHVAHRIGDYKYNAADQVKPSDPQVAAKQ